MASASKKKMEFHRSRQQYWNEEFEKAFVLAKESVKVVETPLVQSMAAYSTSATSNKFTDLDIHMDSHLRRDMENKRTKLRLHKESADNFETYYRVLSAQRENDNLMLDKDDILYFGLFGWTPEDETAKDA